MKTVNLVGVQKRFGNRVARVLITLEAQIDVADLSRVRHGIGNIAVDRSIFRVIAVGHAVKAAVGIVADRGDDLQTRIVRGVVGEVRTRAVAVDRVCDIRHVILGNTDITRSVGEVIVMIIRTADDIAGVVVRRFDRAVFRVPRSAYAVQRNIRIGRVFRRDRRGRAGQDANACLRSCKTGYRNVHSDRLRIGRFGCRGRGYGRTSARFERYGGRIAVYRSKIQNIVGIRIRMLPAVLITQILVSDLKSSVSIGPRAVIVRRSVRRRYS